MRLEYIQAMVRFILGIEEYREAFKPKSERDRRLSLRFWVRIATASLAVLFFSTQQLGQNLHLFMIAPEFVAYAVLYIGLLQAAAPLFYLITLRFSFWFFVTEKYKRDLARRKWPEPLKATLVVASEAILIVLSVLGFLAHPWYLMFLVFLWSIPVGFFYVILPAFVLWGLGNRMFLTLARFDDRLERRQERNP
jgi:hypothetical protein